MSKQLLLPESTVLVRHNNSAKMLCERSGVKFIPLNQDELDLNFSYIYAPADQVLRDEVISNTFRYPNSGWVMGYDPVSDKPGITQIITSFRREMSEREFYREVMNTAIYYDVEIEEENTENMKKFRQRMADAREKLKNKDKSFFAVKPISAELNEKLRLYFDEFNRAWQSILKLHE